MAGCNRAAVANCTPNSVTLSISLICGTVPSVRRDLIDVLFDKNASGADLKKGVTEAIQCG